MVIILLLQHIKQIFMERTATAGKQWSLLT